MPTHRLDSATTTTWMVDQTADIWILGSAGSITGTDITGILADNSIEEATIRVDGDIDLDGQTSIGVGLQTQMGAITVSDTGHVSADNTALYFQNAGGSATIDNAGVLNGYFGIHSTAAQNMTVITNDGRIKASYDGIHVAGAGADTTNSGTIKAQYGIFADSGVYDVDPLLAGNATHIVNTGKITGAIHAIEAGDVAVNIRNRGVLNGDVLLRDGEDVVNTRGGTINGSIDLGAGNDRLDGRKATISGIVLGGDGDDIVTLASPAQVYVEQANEGSDTVRINATYRLGANIEDLALLGKAGHAGIGNSLNNMITGNRGDNALYGLDGLDTLDGGKGNDTLTGGSDADVFVFKPGSGRDTITDFEDGLDCIDFVAFGVNGINSIDDLVISQSGTDVQIRLGDNDVVVLRDVNQSVFDPGDFLFAP